MNPLPDNPVPLAKPTQPGAPLRRRRCVRHEEREAAARCTGCGGFFCRECVVEHEGQLRCAECLAQAGKALAESAVHPKRNLSRYAGWLRFALSVFVLWQIIHWAGWLLLQLPPELHDNKLWEAVENE